MIADVGAGDGAVLYALHRHGLLGERSFAIDAVAERVKVAEEAAPGVVGIVADAVRLPLDDATVDGVICSQVIEHIPDSEKVVSEIARVLRPGGWWYVSSVVRSRHAWWIYRRGGRWWLDPTHVREYAGTDEFTAALRHPDLVISDVETSAFRFPIVELVARIAIAARLIPPRAYRLRGRRVAISPPGYRVVEGAGFRSRGL